MKVLIPYSLAIKLKDSIRKTDFSEDRKIKTLA